MIGTKGIQKILRKTKTIRKAVMLPLTLVYISDRKKVYAAMIDNLTRTDVSSKLPITIQKTTTYGELGRNTNIW